MSTVEHSSSSASLARQIANQKTPIAIAVGEYIKSLLHLPTDTPYIFGKITDVKHGVEDIMPTTKPSENIKMNTDASNEENFKQAA